jgi:hypothetical protein
MPPDIFELLLYLPMSVFYSVLNVIELPLMIVLMPFLWPALSCVDAC